MVSRCDGPAESPSFLEGIQRLEQAIRNYREVLLYSEETPAECRRNLLLVGRVLTDLA